MKTNLVAALALTALAIPPVSGQSLLGIFSVSSDRQLGSIDIATGAASLIGSPIDGTSISTPLTNITYDHAGQRVFFIGDPSGAAGTSLYDVDTTSGTATSAELSGDSTTVAGMEYDQAEDILYAVFNPGGPRRPGVIDPSTGTTSFLGPALSGGVDVSSAFGVIALDSVGDRLFFVGIPTAGSESIYTIDTTTGSSTVQTLSVGSVSSLEFDDDSGTLYGLFFLSGGDRQLGTIDPGTGGVSLLGSPIGGESISAFSGRTCIDYAADELYFVGDPVSLPLGLYTVSTTDGSATRVDLTGASAPNGIVLPVDQFPVDLQSFSID